MTPLQTPSTQAVRTALQPRRLQILELIWDEERSVGDISSRLPVSTAAISQHLTRLRQAGLVRVRQDGRHRYYRATKTDMGALAVVLESFWSGRMDSLAALAEKRERGGRPDQDTGKPHTKEREA